MKFWSAIRGRFHRPNVGAVSELRNLRLIEIGHPWIDRISVSISWLLLILIVFIALLPFPQKTNWNVVGMQVATSVYLAYLLALEILSRKLFRVYDLPLARVIRTLVNIVFVSSLVYFSSDTESYFWCFYVLPIFQENLYFQRRIVTVLFGLTLLAYWLTTVTLNFAHGIPIDYAFLISNSLMMALVATAIYWLFGAARQNRKQEYETLESLRVIALDIAAQRDQDSLLQTIIQRAVEILNAKGGGIYEYDRARQELTVVADWGTKQSIVGHKLKKGEGMAGRVVISGKPMRVPDYSTWPGRCPELEPDLFRAVIEVPLGEEEQTIGVLYVTDDAKGRTFSESDEDLLGLLASHAAITLNNVKAFEASERNLAQLQLIHRINATMAHTTSVDDLFETTLKEALNAIEATDGSIMIFDPKTDELEFKAWIVDGVFRDCSSHKRLHLNEGIAGHVASTHEPYNCKDTELDKNFVRSVTERRLRSILSVPILSNKNLVCVINADSDRPSAFADTDVKLFSTVGAHLATALEALRLREVGFLLSSASLEDLPTSIVESAANLLNADVATLFLRDKEGKIVRGAVYPPAEGGNADPPRGDGLTNQILSSGEHQIIEDAQSDDNVKPELKERGIRSLIGVPLNVTLNDEDRPQTIGVLFASTRKLRQFGQGERCLLESLASQASVAIMKGRLYAKDLAERMFQRSLLASAFDAIIALDRAGDIKEFNTSAERILGYTGQEVLGKNVSFLYADPETPKKIMRQLLNPRNKGRLVNFYTHVKPKEGDPIPIRLSASLVENGSVGFFRDQREIENMRRHVQQLHGVFAVDQETAQLNDLQEILQNTARTAQETLRADVVCVYYYDQDAGEFEMPAIKQGSKHGNQDHGESRLLPYLKVLINQGDPYFAGTVEADNSMAAAFAELEDVAAVAAGRVQTRSNAFAVIVCGFRDSRAFRDDEQIAIRNHIAEAAIRIEHALERLDVTKLLERIYKAALALTTETSFETKLLAQLKNAVKSTDAKYGALGLVSQTHKTFLHTGVDEELAKRLTPPKMHGLLNRFLREDEVINLPDVRESGFHTTFGDPEHPEITSFLGRSIVLKGLPVGNIYVGNKKGKEQFTVTDEEVLRLFATLASALIEHHSQQEVANTKQAITIGALLLSQLRLAAQEKGAKISAELEKLHKLLPQGPDLDALLMITRQIRGLDTDIIGIQAGLEKGPSELFNLDQVLYDIEGQHVVPPEILQIDAQPACLVRGNFLLMTLACRILIENSFRAIKKTDRRGSIVVTCETKGDLVRATIKDNGCGIPKLLRPVLFREPVLNQKQELCYASFIVGVIMRLHGGGISIVETGTGGTLFEFSVPAEKIELV